MDFGRFRSVVLTWLLVLGLAYPAAAQLDGLFQKAKPEAERSWWEHVQAVAAEGLKATTASWYLGANVQGKARVFMPYFGGFPAYCEKCESVAAAGYEGFAIS